MPRRKTTRSTCLTNSRHWFQGEPICQRCGAPNPNYVEPAAATNQPNRWDRALALLRQFASYECAGIDQDVDDTTLCGQCGPCEANALLREMGKSR